MKLPLSPAQLTSILLTVMALAIGQVLFRLAALRMNPNLPALQQWGLNPHLWAALVVYGVATIAWVAVLRQVPLHLAYPFVALAFFLVPLLAFWLLNEPVRWSTWVGAFLIASGVWISVAFE